MVATTSQTFMLDEATDQGILFSRSQTVSRILELNPTTTASFLDSFSDESLEHYLARLNVAQQPRPACWIRVGGVPAIQSREARA